jgi:CPA1 family monovalent cation:H+ antiporter
MVGLQIGPILDRVGPAERHNIFTCAAAVLITVILARGIWVGIYNWGLWLLNRAFGRVAPWAITAPDFGRGLVVAWCGMRGIVTLAAALALPDGSGGGVAFPFRDLIVLTAFTVVLGTLVIQGLTLRPLLMMLNLSDDEALETEVRAGREEIIRAAYESVEPLDNDVAKKLRGEFLELVRRVDGTGGMTDEAKAAEIGLRRQARAASRERLRELRMSGTIGDSAFHQLESELDTIELNSEVRSRW